jgi:hypothetical protein
MGGVMSAATASGTLRDLVEHAAQGNRLSRHDGRGGERDFWLQFSDRDRRRLWSSGFVSSDGFEPDKFAEIVRYSGALPMELGNGNADEICGWWARLVLESLDMGAGRDRVFDRRGELRPGALDDPELGVHRPGSSSDELPAWVTDWLAGLVHAPKRAYAEAYCRSVFSGGIAPERLEHPWVKKVEDKVARRLAAQVAKGGE